MANLIILRSGLGWRGLNATPSIERRDFLTLLGGAAVAWPLAARAQQSERMRRIGVLMNIAADDPEAQSRMIAFVQALAQLGWMTGRNVKIEFGRRANGSGQTEKNSARAYLVRFTP